VSKPGYVTGLRTTAWKALKRLQSIIEAENTDVELVVKGCYALPGLIRCYVELLHEHERITEAAAKKREDGKWFTYHPPSTGPVYWENDEGETYYNGTDPEDSTVYVLDSSGKIVPQAPEASNGAGAEL